MSKIVIVGEAWGEAEDRQRAPFVGAAGHELTSMLKQAGIKRSDCFLTNVFNRRPPANKIEAFCGPKAEALKGWPALIKSKYVREEFAPELERLGDELIAENPNIIICLGNTPTWALTGKTGIAKIRGTTMLSTHVVKDFKILPTYHPAAVLRQWEIRPIAVIDLAKAYRESHYPEIRRPHREIWIEPTIEDINEYRRTKLDVADRISVDIETAGNQITCIGFAADRHSAIVIPFVDYRRTGKSYWPTTADERKAWEIIRDILGSPLPPKTFQNGLYDIAFLWRSMKIKVYGAEHDTMLLHHSLQPETLKSLDFLGSIYTDEGAWKQMRKVQTIKKDD